MSLQRRVFRQIRGRARLGIVIEGAALLAFTFGVFTLVSFAVDRSLRLETGYRLVLLLIVAVVLARILHARMLRPLGVDLSDEEMALAVERADPGVRQALISALQFEEALERPQDIAESPELMDAVVQDVERRTAQMDTAHAVDRNRVARFAAVLAATMLAIGVWVALAPATAKLWALRNLALSSAEWPRYTHLAFGAGADDVVRVPEGDDLTLTVRAEGLMPEQAFLHYSFEAGEGGIEAMTATGENEFSFTMQSVLEGAVVWATGGDGLTPELRIEVVERPRIEDLQVTLIYPDYMRKENDVLASIEGDLRVPRGGVLELQARSTKKLESARVTFGQDQRIPIALDDDGHQLSGRFEPTETGLLTVNVIDLDRLDAGRPPQLFLRLVEDRAPGVDFRPTGVGSIITPIARIPGMLKVRDDYGLARVAAQYRVTGRADGAAEVTPGEQLEQNGEAGAVEQAAEKETPWEAAEVFGLASFTEGEVAYDEQVAFDLRPLHPEGEPTEDSVLQPGQFVSLRFSARDNFGPGDPHEGSSDEVVFQIVTREKLMEDLARRQGEQRRELELVLERERADLAVLREIVSPAADDPRAAAARLRVLALARSQRALGKRARSVADNYRQILDEFVNNRVLEPGNVAELRRQIQEPLERLAAEDFPASASSVQDFAHSGQEDVRAVIVLSYESIIERLEQVLGHMEEAETFATLLEGLRQTIKLQNSAMREAQQKRKDEASSLFGPSGDKPGEKPIKKPDK